MDNPASHTWTRGGGWGCRSTAMVFFSFLRDSAMGKWLYFVLCKLLLWISMDRSDDGVKTCLSFGVGLVCGKCSSSPVSSTTKSWSWQPIAKCPLDETQHQVSPQQRKPGKKPRRNPISKVQQPSRICRCHTGQKKNTILNDNFHRNKLEIAPWFSIRNRSPSVTNNKERRTLGRERESSSSTTDRSTERNSTP